MTSITRPEGPCPKPGISAIAPYQPGKSSTGSGGRVYKLSSNENPLGAAPAAVAAARDAIGGGIEFYPAPGAPQLRDAIARRYGLDESRIVCSSGSDELIALLCNGYLAPGDEMVQTEHGFNIYAIQTLAAGGTPVFARETDLTADVDAILAAVTGRTRLVFIANPNNPTGTYISASEMKRLAESLPRNVLLVIDAAYAEYVRAGDYSSGVELAATMDNVVMTRTFSKIHGLAGLRIGWLYGPAAVVDTINRIRGPFNLSTPAIAAGVAAMEDPAHEAASVAHNETWLPRTVQALEALGLAVTPSAGNFVLVHFPDEDGRRAPDADKALQAAGILARRMESYRLPNALRITIGSPEAMELTFATLARFLGRT